MKKFLVLLAEPDPMVAFMTGQFLRGASGFSLAGIASDCPGLRDALKTVSYDLVLLDPGLPGADRSSAVHLVQRESRAFMILMGAIRGRESIDDLLGYRVFDYLLKPFAFDRMSASLSSFMSYRRMKNHLPDVLDQRAINSLLEGRRCLLPVGAETPKGIQPSLLGKISALFESADGAAEGLSPGNVVRLCGVSRTTAWRYLEYLTSRGFVRKTFANVSVGRPIAVYKRWKNGKESGQAPSEAGADKGEFSVVQKEGSGLCGKSAEASMR